MFKKLKFFSQRGAMFGLDARIALAIFGTLAIISGYVGISKFQTAQDAAFIKEILAYEDAIEQIQTDVGVFYQFAIDNSDNRNDYLAIEDGSLIDPKYRNRWNGPYIDGIELDHRYGIIYLHYMTESVGTPCTINTNCYVWIRVTEVPESVWTRFNQMIDENAGQDPEGTPHTQGRIQSPSTNDPRAFYYRTSVVRRAG